MPVTSPLGLPMTAVPLLVLKIDRQPLVTLLQVRAPMKSRLLLASCIEVWKPSPMATPLLVTARFEVESTSSLPDLLPCVPATYRLPELSSRPTLAPETGVLAVTVPLAMSSTLTRAVVPPHSAPQLRMNALESSEVKKAATGRSKGGE